MKISHGAVGAKKSMYLQGNVRYENDPKTGKPVGNLFTDSTAYADCPIDGSTAFNTKINYLSRKNQFENMPVQQAGTSNSSKVNAAANYRYTGYNDKDVSSYAYGVDMGLYLVGVEQEGAAPLRATVEQLNGSDTSVSLTFNKEVIDMLLDYESEFWDYFLNQLTESDVKNIIGLGGFQTVELYNIGKPRCTDKDGPAGFNNNVTNGGQLQRLNC